jgi:hypothetical protein
MTCPTLRSRAAAGLGRRWVSAGLLLAAGGCTVNGAGVAVGGGVRYYANDAGTGRGVAIDVWGVNVSTVEGDGGITVGRTRRAYYFAGGASNGLTAPTTRPGDSAGGHLSGSAERLRLKPAARFDWGAARPLVVRGRSDGVSAGAGAAGATVTVGVRAFDAVRLPADSNLLMFLRTDGRRPDGDVFHVMEVGR